MRLGLLSQRTPEELLGLLEEGRAARLVARCRVPRAGSRFSHGLVRETLYDDLPAVARLRRPHRRVGEMLLRSTHRISSRTWPSSRITSLRRCPAAM